MKPTYIFPAVMIIMGIGAAVMCVIGKDYKKSSLLDCCGGSERLCNILKGEWKS